MNWIRIILYILRLIAKGLTKNEAVLQASMVYQKSVKEILSHL